MYQNVEKQRGLLMSRNTAFLPDIEEGVANMVIEDLSQLAMGDPEFIAMVIKSNGGITDDGFVLAQFIEHELGIPVHARVLGYCHSAATYPLLCCEMRTGYSHSKFVLHHQTTSMQTRYDPDTFDAEVDSWKKENHATFQQQLNFYMQKLGKSQEEAREILDAGSAGVNNEINAQKALKLGILTEIAQNEKEPPP